MADFDLVDESVADEIAPDVFAMLTAEAPRRADISVAAAVAGLRNECGART